MLLVISEGSVETGYGRVATTLLDQLHHLYDCALFAVDHRRPLQPPHWRFLPNELGGDNLGISQFPSILKQLRPSALVFIHDYYLFPAYVRQIPDVASCPSIVSFPIDGNITDDRAFAPLSAAARIVVFTEFARRELAACFARLAASSDLLQPPAITVIPHPVDTRCFPQLPGAHARRDSRRELIGSHDLDDAFIVLNANRNTTRKRIDLTLEAFAEFARDKPSGVKLYLHMGLRDKGVDIRSLAIRLDIVDRLLLTTDSDRPPAIPTESLNLIYNACDVGVNTSLGEGWGLVAFEHGATGAAQVVPAHSVLSELWESHGLTVRAPQVFQHPREPVSHRIVDTHELATALENLYRDPVGLDYWSRCACSHARKEVFSPTAVAARWQAVIADLPIPKHPARDASPAAQPPS
jgi:D-inositol-3-phosphate glycosyltransferase